MSQWGNYPLTEEYKNKHRKMKVALLIVATGKYINFLPDLIQSAQKYFLKEHDVKFHVFTDQPLYVGGRTTFHFVEHKPWPHATLYRFHFFKEYQIALDADYFFYVDVDTLFKAPITTEILSERTAVRHCGFINVRGSYETNPKSTSFVAEDEGEYYYGGGFWGFSKKEFWKFVETAINMISLDSSNGITPVHNDESVLNRYLIDNPPAKVLSPEYHYPQSELPYYQKIWGRDYECKILLLDKKHEEVRA